MYKQCSSCQEEKLLSNFRKDKTQTSGYQPRCKICARQAGSVTYQKYREKTIARNYERQKAARQLVSNYRETHSCTYCDENDPVCLDFHHRDPKTKSFKLSSVTTQSTKTIMEEIKKCVLICANCHRKVHAGKIIL